MINNLIVDSGTSGIDFEGDPNGGPVPFGRIVNNTIYGASTPLGTGIKVANSAGPTILNNIISNVATGISVDASSSPNTVVGYTLFKGNTSPGTGWTDSQLITLTAAQPLFVNPANNDFYLEAGSAAIGRLAQQPAGTTDAGRGGSAAGHSAVSDSGTGV